MSRRHKNDFCQIVPLEVTEFKPPSGRSRVGRMQTGRSTRLARIFEEESIPLGLQRAQSSRMRAPPTTMSPLGAFNLLGARRSVLSDLSTRGAKHSRFLCDPLRLTVRNAALSIGHMCCLLSCVLFAGERPAWKRPVPPIPPPIPTLRRRSSQSVSRNATSRRRPDWRCGATATGATRRPQGGGTRVRGSRPLSPLGGRE